MSIRAAARAQDQKWEVGSGRNLRIIGIGQSTGELFIRAEEVFDKVQQVKQESTIEELRFTVLLRILCCREDVFRLRQRS